MTHHHDPTAREPSIQDESSGAGPISPGAATPSKPPAEPLALAPIITKSLLASLFSASLLLVATPYPDVTLAPLPHVIAVVASVCLMWAGVRIGHVLTLVTIGSLTWALVTALVPLWSTWVRGEAAPGAQYPMGHLAACAIIGTVAVIVLGGRTTRERFGLRRRTSGALVTALIALAVTQSIVLFRPMANVHPGQLGVDNALLGGVLLIALFVRRLDRAVALAMVVAGAALHTGLAGALNVLTTSQPPMPLAHVGLVAAATAVVIVGARRPDEPARH